MRFSERYGHRPINQTILTDSISEPLRNSLWNLLQIYIWDRTSRGGDYSTFFQSNPRIKILLTQLWFNFFKRPLDTMPSRKEDLYQLFRHEFFSSRWFEAYDLLEFVAQNFPYDTQDTFIEQCNAVLKIEMSAYRLVDGRIAPITSEEEIRAIDDAINTGEEPVQNHLRRALELLSDRQNPDYRNSIKESISSVESLVQLTLGQQGTLGKLIGKLEGDINLHPALSKAFSNIYGYSSDEHGVRHAMLEAPNIELADARFFLVVCSAFVNYVTERLKT